MRFNRTWLLLGSAVLPAMLLAGPALAANFTVPPNISNGQAMAAGDTLVVSSGGTVINTINNDAVSGTGATSITNGGSITATGTNAAAIEITGVVGSITNSGTMSADTYNAVYVHGDITTFTNEATGFITAGSDETTRVTGTTGTYINRGTITNTGTGSFTGDGATFGGMVTSFTNESGATISAAGDAAPAPTYWPASMAAARSARSPSRRGRSTRGT